MNPDSLSVLFLCTGNSARSILGEYLLRRIDPARFKTASAGSHPKGQVHPMAIEVLKDRYGVDASDAKSESIADYQGRAFDLVVTVCDNARESCPYFPGAGAQVHWGLPDPAAIEERAEQRRAFEEVAAVLESRLERLASLPPEAFTRDQLPAALAAQSAEEMG